jgi:hypothetical protein
MMSLFGYIAAPPTIGTVFDIGMLSAIGMLLPPFMGAQADSAATERASAANLIEFMMSSLVLRGETPRLRHWSSYAPRFSMDALLVVSL